MTRTCLQFAFGCLILLSACSPGKRALVKGYNSFSDGDYDVAIGQYQAWPLIGAYELPKLIMALPKLTD